MHTPQRHDERYGIEIDTVIVRMGGQLSATGNSVGLKNILYSRTLSLFKSPNYFYLAGEYVYNGELEF